MKKTKPSFRFSVRSVETGGVLSFFKTFQEAKDEIVRLQCIQYQNKLRLIDYEIFDNRLNKVVFESDSYHF